MTMEFARAYIFDYIGQFHNTRKLRKHEHTHP